MEASQRFYHVPSWVLRPLPANANVDTDLPAKIDQFCNDLPQQLIQLTAALDLAAVSVNYDAAVNHANARIWSGLRNFWTADQESKVLLARYVKHHFTPRARMRVLRRLAKDPDLRVRRECLRIIEGLQFPEVSVPAAVNPERPELADWSVDGWFAGLSANSLHRERQLNPHLTTVLPDLPDIAALRNLLEIKTRRQLGWLLLATDTVQDGPYVAFTIPKRDGTTRTICAPKFSLLRVQRRILSSILNLIPTHPAAHGFVKGRSTVTNAEPHQGAPLILKFDLEDFFPTIHYYRVLGLFLSLGYGITTGRFSSQDQSLDVASTLARLCCYTPQATKFGSGYLPQGAPSSPAISNLVCRRLDARLAGLAEQFGAVYTRYADDLTFSFRDADANVGRFRWWVDQLCHQEGFFVHQAKFRAIRNSQRQTVTGIVVNDTLHIPREIRRRFRAMLHNCQKHGVVVASRGDPGFVGYLRGFASYYAMVCPEEGRAALKLVRDLLRRPTEETP